MRIIVEPEKINPVLADEAIIAMQAELRTLPWLDQVFGRAWPIVLNKGGRKYTEPCVYTKGNSYETVIPSADLGNYSFFVLNDAFSVDDAVKISPNVKVRTPFSLIVWFDLRKCFNDGENRRDTENLKADVIDAIKRARVKKGYVSLTRGYEEWKKVFTGFNVDAERNLCLMQPYGGFRIDGYIESQWPC